MDKLTWCKIISSILMLVVGLVLIGVLTDDIITTNEYSMAAAPVVRNKVLTTLPVWGRVYEIKFDIFVNKFPNGSKWGSLLRLTSSSKNTCASGGCVPRLMLHGEKGKLFFQSYPDGKSSPKSEYGYAHEITTLTRNAWIPVRIEQAVKSQGKYEIRLSVNGKLEHVCDIPRPAVYTDVKVYTGSQWAAPADAMVRNVNLTSSDIAVAGKWATWSQWSSSCLRCSAYKRTTRERACTKPPPSNGGKGCGLGKTQTETKKCNAWPCSGGSNSSEITTAYNPVVSSAATSRHNCCALLFLAALFTLLIKV